MNAPFLGIVVAMAKNRGIGKANALPWRIPEDLKRFRALTTGHTVIMGRSTFESIGKPLPHRRNIVVTTTRSTIEGCDVAPTFEAALDMARSTDTMPLVIGGAQLYAQALPLATHLFLTEVDREVEADTFFPVWQRSQWKEVSRVSGQTPGVEFVDLVRAP
jgi:dihydrofolate reductase